MSVDLEKLLEKAHDELLKDASHDKDNCLICEDRKPSEKSNGGSTVSGEFSKEDLNKAVADALAPVQAELEKFKKAEADNDVEGRIQTAREELQNQIDELQAKLDTAVLEKNNLVAEKDAAVEAAAKVQNDWDTEKREAEEAANLETLKAQRVEEVKKVAAFTDAELEERADRWAGMSDEVFTAQLEDFKVVSKPRTETEKNDTIPESGLETASRQLGNDKPSVFDYISDLQAAGFNSKSRI